MFRNRLSYCCLGPAFLIVAFLQSPLTLGETYTLRDGRSLSGRSSPISGVAEDPLRPRINPGGVDTAPILVIDDDLRRTYVPKQQVVLPFDPTDQSLVKISVEQNVATSGSAIGSVGPVVRISPFDEYGRRIFTMNTTEGPIDIVQGITVITPVYTKVEGLSGPRRPILWDMRLATSSIPRKTLEAILKHAVPQDDSQARLSVVRLYLQSERYQDARLELEQIVKNFPELESLDQEIRELRQMGARRALAEIKLRSDAGQHQYVQRLLTNFPADEVAGETLQQVREILAEYDMRQQKIDQVKKYLSGAIAGIGNATVRDQAAQFAKEIHDELNFNNLARLAPLLQLGDDKSLTPEERVALAISGWFLGANSATDNLPVALSLIGIRQYVREYLGEKNHPRRKQIIEYLLAKEGATVEQVAKMIRHMKPPCDPAPTLDKKIYGYYERRVPGLDDHPEVRYLVQLPPEYDTHRSYPAIVTLNGAGSTPELQLDFWAGSIVWSDEPSEPANSTKSEPQKKRAGDDQQRGIRMGQTMRHGFITIAVDWQRPRQHAYEFSAREHHAVLSVLRDAYRNFSIDTDRVFLSGHDIGGDAAWDLAQAHPDLWAGVLPIVAQADRYSVIYWPNAKWIPLYFVAGELDGAMMKENALNFDRYLRYGYDTTVVEFLGRGHEIFSDEIQRLFDWMRRRQRNFFPKEFECVTLRRWDNFFWWLEVDGLPQQSIIEPEAWSYAESRRPAKLKGVISTTNTIIARTGADRTVIWLAPEMVDFDKPKTISVDGRRFKESQDSIRPNLETLLEDVRTRGERHHPFWAKVAVP